MTKYSATALSKHALNDRSLIEACQNDRPECSPALKVGCCTAGEFLFGQRENEFKYLLKAYTLLTNNKNPCSVE
jgi:hypothetical protein